MRPVKRRTTAALIGGLATAALVVTPGIALAAPDYPAIEEGQIQYVSDVEWQYAKTGYGTYQRDWRNWGNSDKNNYTMQVAGQKFDKGVGLHVADPGKDPAAVHLATDSKCTQFLSYVGIDDSGTGANGSKYGKFVVTGDYSDGSSSVLASVEQIQGQVASLIDVDITGVQTLKLEVLVKDGGNNGGSFADYGEATLNCTDNAIAFPVRVFPGNDTDYTRLTPGAPASVVVHDALPGSTAVVMLDGVALGSTAIADQGSTTLNFTIPADITNTSPEFTVVAVDRASTAHYIPVSGTVIIPHTGDYYVDCAAQVQGDGKEATPFNSLDPLNEMREFAAGTRILLKAGTECKGRLELQGDGTADNRNIITSYGEGERPIINADGAGNAIELIDTSYWTIEGLRITNPATLTTSSPERQGIMVRSLSTAPKASIVINDNVIDDVAGWTNKTGNDSRYRNSAGIVVMSDHELAGANPGLTDGITITNNKISNAGGGGIKLQGDGQISAGLFHENVYVAHNDIVEVGGDAIVIHASNSALVEHNNAIDVGHGKYPFAAGNFAGIWGMTSQELLFRYNVVGNSVTSTYDSTAWDCDWGMKGNSCIFEYNYSYGNAGGTYLDCISGCVNAATQTKAVIRYNVMQDDCRLAGASGGPAHTLIYNNVFYCPTKTFVDDMKGPRTVFNNIFVADSANWDSVTNSDNQRIYSNNAYLGGIQPSALETNAITSEADLGLLAPGSSNETFDVSGYQLLKGSPLLSAGVDLDSFSGADIFGNVTSGTHNIGVYEGDGVDARPLDWSEARNTTSIAHPSNLRTGGVAFTNATNAARGKGRIAYLASALDVVSGQNITTDDEFSFIWDDVRAGTPDSVKATGQQIAVNQGGQKLHYVGFSAGDNRGGEAVINYADGSSQTFEMTLPNWRETSGEAEAIATADTYNQHKGSYLSEVATMTGKTYVYASSVQLNNPYSKIVSVTLPDGSPVIGSGLTLFAMGVSGEMEEPEVPTVTEIVLDKDSVPAGGSVVITGLQFGPGVAVDIKLGDHVLASTVSNGEGGFEAEVTIPAGTAAGDYKLIAYSGDLPLAEARVAVTDPVDPPVDPEYDPQITVSSDDVVAGDVVLVEGTGFAPESAITVSMGQSELATATTDEDGKFSVSVTIPEVGPGTHVIRAASTEPELSAEVSVGVSGLIDPPVHPGYDPQITVDVTEVKPGDPIVVTGTGFAPGIDVVVSLGDTVLGTFHTSDVASARALAAGGEFSGQVTVPASTVSGQHTLKVAAKDGSHSAQLAITVKAGDPGETPDPKPGEKPEEKPGTKKPGTLPNVGATVAMLGFAGLALAGSGYVIRRQSRREKA